MLHLSPKRGRQRRPGVGPMSAQEENRTGTRDASQLGEPGVLSRLSHMCKDGKREHEIERLVLESERGEPLIAGEVSEWDVLGAPPHTLAVDIRPCQIERRASQSSHRRVRPQPHPKSSTLVKDSIDRSSARARPPSRSENAAPSHFEEALRVGKRVDARAERCWWHGYPPFGRRRSRTSWIPASARRKMRRYAKIAAGSNGAGTCGFSAWRSRLDAIDPPGDSEATIAPSRLSKSSSSPHGQLAQGMTILVDRPCRNQL